MRALIKLMYAEQSTSSYVFCVLYVPCPPAGGVKSTPTHLRVLCGRKK